MRRVLFVLATTGVLSACSWIHFGKEEKPPYELIQEHPGTFAIKANLPDGGVAVTHLEGVKTGERIEGVVTRIIPASELAQADAGSLTPELLDAISECRADTHCTSLGQLLSTRPLLKREFHTWCLLAGVPFDPAASVDAGTVGPPVELDSALLARYETHRVCTAIYASEIAGGEPALGAVSIAQLAALAETAPAPRYRCNGWGLMLPFFAIRHPGPGKDTTITGPVTSGIGGGYYIADGWPGVCRKDWSAGWSFSAFSQGLTPGENVQIGLSAGLGFTVNAPIRFHFGVDQGFDLFRQVKGADGALHTNSIFNHWGTQPIGQMYLENSVWMFTIGVETSATPTADGGT